MRIDVKIDRAFTDTYIEIKTNELTPALQAAIQLLQSTEGDLDNQIIVQQEKKTLFIEVQSICVLQQKSAENCNEKYRVLPPNIFPTFSTMHWLNGSSDPCMK